MTPEMTSPESGGTDDKNETDAGIYFDGSEAIWQSLEEEREELRRRQEAVKELDNLVREIDCNIGGASMEVDVEEGTIRVQTITEHMTEEVKELVHGYCWSRKFDIGYVTRNRCITWDLQTHMDTLVKDFQGETQS